VSRVWTAGLVVALALALAASPSALAKGKATVKVSQSATPNVLIPDGAPGNGLDGVLNSTIEVGKRFRGRRIRDVNATVHTLGATGNTPAGDLQAILRSPSGTHTVLFVLMIGPSMAPNLSIGPLTLDDESPIATGVLNPHNPRELYAPWVGIARPRLGKPLALMDGGPVSGTWTLTMVDFSDTQTSVLASWSLDIVAGKPYRTK
jgi:hypothetical protein